MKWTATALIEGTGAEDPNKRQMRKVYADIYEVNYLEVKKKRDKASKTERAKMPQPFGMCSLFSMPYSAAKSLTRGPQSRSGATT
jgi:hypothetical protein